MTLVALSLTLGSFKSFAQSTDREWSDATGSFKITATLLEVKDNAAFLKTLEGKTLRIPVARLSQSDQEFLKGGANPFEEVDSRAVSPVTSMSSSAMPTATSDSSFWSQDVKIDWGSVEQLDRDFGDSWNVKLSDSNELAFEPKRATLSKKSNFHEGLRRLDINPIAKRAIAGFTVSFTVPRPQSRVSLIDLITGKAIHTSPVEADMCPLGLLNDGSTAIMQGSGDSNKGTETSDQIQLWRITGKDVVRSPMWTPFLGTEKRFGKVQNSPVSAAIALPNNRLLLKSEHGHLACIDVATRKPYWFTKLSNNGSIDAMVDRSLIAALDGSTVLIIDPQAGKVVGAVPIEGKPHVAWPRLRWSPSGKRLLVTINTQMFVLDATNGQWLYQHTFSGGPIAADGLGYPADDYALLNDRLLVHIPSQIKVCDYRDATIRVVGGTAFVGMQSADSGLVVPAKIPHPAAAEILEQAETDPTVFLIHPGVEVSIDAGAAGQWASQVKDSLEQAATTAGYKVTSNAPISIVASITGPKQEAVSYIASGAYIASVFQSSIRVTWQGKDVWSTSASNVPGFLQTERGQSIQDKLNEIGKTPNLNVFQGVRFPKLLQRPAAEGQGGNRSEALLVSKFTMTGLVDSK